MLRLRGGWILDAAGLPAGSGDLLISPHGIVRIDSEATADAEPTDCDGLWIVPGLVDLRTHLREPGEEHKEDIESGLSAAAAGGYSAVCPLPATQPVHDVRAVTEQMLARAAGRGVRMWPFGAITKGLVGKELAEMADMQAAGIVGVSDDRHAITNLALLRRAMEYARTFDLPIAVHCEQPALTGRALMHEGVVSTQLGLVGSPASAEEAAVAAVLSLARETGARVHLSHLSAAGSVEQLRRAKAEGLSASADVSPHHLTFTDAALRDFDPQYKVLPPLRSERHRAALRAGVNDGTIDAIATDHAPHAPLDKRCEFSAAAPGVIGLETAVSMVCALIQEGTLDRAPALKAMSDGAAHVLGRPTGYARGDVTVIDPTHRWVATPSSLRSKSLNTPCLDQEMVGAARYTVVNGEVIFSRKAA